jgi:EAL domain-containing protein (putative c-di-GMP-specific phosphodiesterase class I)
VVAEGVETQDQLLVIQEYTCPEAQGHFFSQPLSATKFSALLRRDLRGGLIAAAVLS